MKLLIDASVLKGPETCPIGFVTGLYEMKKIGIPYGTNMTAGNYPLITIFANEGIVPEQAESGEYILSFANNSFILDPGKITISDFTEVARMLMPQRRAEKTRITKETEISVKVNLDGSGEHEISTGIGFFDHMLCQIARHGNIDLQIQCKGDLHIDEHHTVEDTGILLGETILTALGDKRGIKRYGYMVPMDDCIAACAIDLGGRISLSYTAKFRRERIGDFPVELAEEFFRALASGMRSNIYLKVKGKNEHHKIESLFKAFAKSLNEACRMDERAGTNLPSTKGVL